MQDENNNVTTIKIGGSRKRKAIITSLLELEKGQKLIHEHITSTGEPLKTPFSGWIAIQRHRFKKNFKGKKLEQPPKISPSGKEIHSYEVTVIDFDPNRKPRKPRTQKTDPATTPSV